MIEKIKIKTVVNNIEYSNLVEPRLLASDYIRDNLNLTGTHIGCEHGVCGSCTIKINGVTARACLKFAVQLNGKKVETVESLSENSEKKFILNAFKKHHALQCGFCTPGFLMTVDELLEDNQLLTEEEIRSYLSGNLCRCTGYENIVKAVKELMKRKRP